MYNQNHPWHNRQKLQGHQLRRSLVFLSSLLFSRYLSLSFFILSFSPASSPCCFPTYFGSFLPLFLFTFFVFSFSSVLSLSLTLSFSPSLSHFIIRCFCFFVYLLSCCSGAVWNVVQESQQFSAVWN